jgi:hypothetical protein
MNAGHVQPGIVPGDGPPWAEAGIANDDKQAPISTNFKDAFMARRSTARA